MTAQGSGCGRAGAQSWHRALVGTALPRQSWHPQVLPPQLQTLPRSCPELRGPGGAVMVFWWEADASLSLTAYDKYGACCQGKIYPFLSFYQLSNMLDFSQALSVAGI